MICCAVLLYLYVLYPLTVRLLAAWPARAWRTHMQQHDVEWWRQLILYAAILIIIIGICVGMLVTPARRPPPPPVVRPPPPSPAPQHEGQDNYVPRENNYNIGPGLIWAAPDHQRP